MTVLLIATIGHMILKLVLGGTAIFLILLVLVQRGRGGGLAGALGGMGGSSAFGAKAGDVFTRVTVIAATFWIVLCIVAARMVPSSQSRIDTNVTETVTSTADISTTDIGPVLTADDAEQADAETTEESATSDEPTSDQPTSDESQSDGEQSK